jgi:hypothetical protein
MRLNNLSFAFFRITTPMHSRDYNYLSSVRECAVTLGLESSKTYVSKGHESFALSSTSSGGWCY